MPSVSSCLRMGSDRDERPFDVLDMIINLLREHEKTLDELIYRVEEALSARAPEPIPPREPTPPPAGVSAVLRDWEGFKRRCAYARLLGFVAGDKKFKVTAIAAGVLYVYEEEVPSLKVLYRKEDDEVKIVGVEADDIDLIPKALRRRLDCGLEFGIREVEMGETDGVSARRITWLVKPSAVRDWLAIELRIEPSTIVEGELKLQGVD